MTKEMNISVRKQMDQHGEQTVNMDLCFELIFPYLTVPDLVSVADTCKLMKINAELVFAQKYKNKLISLRYWYSHEGNLKMTEEKLIVYSIKISLGVLRCFGDSITKLSIDYQGFFEGEPLNNLTDEYVSKYCAQNLKELTLKNKSYTFINLTKPFPNIQKLRLIKIMDKDYRSAQFNSLFPNLRSLDFHSLVNLPVNIAVQFPKLEHLALPIKIICPLFGFEKDLQEADAFTLLKLNSTIRHFCLYSPAACNAREYLRKVSEICKNLEILEVHNLKWFYGFWESNNIRFKSVKKLILIDCDLDYSILHGTFDVLETLTYSPKGEPYHLFDFIRQHPSITKLNLSIKKISIKQRLSEIAASFGLIEEIEVFNPLSAEDAIHLLDHCKSLKKLIFEVKMNFDYGYFMQLMDKRRGITIKIDESFKNIRTTCDYCISNFELIFF